MAVTLEELVFSLTVRGEAQVNTALSRTKQHFDVVSQSAVRMTRAVSDAARVFEKFQAVSHLAASIKMPDMTSNLAGMKAGLDAVSAAAAHAVQQVAGLNARFPGMPGAGQAAPGLHASALPDFSVLNRSVTALAQSMVQAGRAGLAFAQSLSRLKLPNLSQTVNAHGANSVILPNYARAARAVDDLTRSVIRAAHAALDFTQAAARFKAPSLTTTIPVTPQVPKFDWQSVIGKIAVARAISSAVGGLLNLVHTFVSSIGNLMRQGIDRALKLGESVMNIRQVSGASVRQSAEFATMAQITGVQDTTALRELGRLSMAVRTPRQSQALGQLGLSAHMDGNAIDMFDQVLARLSKMQDGMKKTRIETELFGMRGVKALQPLLRLTEFQRKQVFDLSMHFDPNALATIQKLTTSLALLGETVIQRIVMPFAERFGPTITAVIDKITQFVNKLADIDTKSHGLVSVAIAVAGIAAAFAAVAVAIGTIANIVAPAITAFVALATAIRGAAIAQAVLDALMGNFGAVAAALGIGAAAAAGFYAYDKANAKHDPAGADTAKNTKDAAQTLREIHSQIIGGGDRAHRGAAIGEYEAARRFAGQLA